LHFCKPCWAIFSHCGISLAEVAASLGFVDMAPRNGNSACAAERRHF
jgi:hypothetical protein